MATDCVMYQAINFAAKSSHHCNDYHYFLDAYVFLPLVQCMKFKSAQK